MGMDPRHWFHRNLKLAPARTQIWRDLRACITPGFNVCQRVHRWHRSVMEPAGRYQNIHNGASKWGRNTRVQVPTLTINYQLNLTRFT